MSLSRESLSDNSFREKIVAEAPDHVELMDAAEFEASRRAILDAARDPSGFWVFAYGSLIWNPIVEVAETRPARLNGHSRRFCVWAPVGRGTPECQGLWLGLDDGGTCDGVALRLPDERIDEETTILWRREMIGGVYRPALRQLDTDQGPVTALVFLANPEHGRYAAHVDHAEKVAAIARAEGSLGTCRAYLYALDERLHAHGLADPYIHSLTGEVRAAAGE